MAGRIFSPGANVWMRFALLGAALALGLLLLLAGGFVNSDWRTEKNVAPAQPVPFSHKHHVSGLGLDCRYCHTTVETEASAGYPPTQTCMTCHSQIWTGASELDPVRTSLAQNAPLRWRRVYDLPDFAYFNHSIHVEKGVGCDVCHGRVDQQHQVRIAIRLQMTFCIECHWDPADRLRPKEQVFNLAWTPPQDRQALGERLMKEYHVKGDDLDHCYLCHR